MEEHLAPDVRALTAYVSGDASPEDSTIVERWMREDPQRRQWIHELEAALRVTELSEPKPLDYEAFGVSIAQLTGVPSFASAFKESNGASAVPVSSPTTNIRQETFARRTKPARVGRHRRVVWTALGAGLTVVMGVLIGTGRLHDRSETAQRVYRSAPGEQLSVRLDDGSTIRLAPASTVTVTQRTVDVIGSAYFTVAPSASRPFMVQTTNTVVQVLGTTFAVRKYDDDRDTRVVVETGKVAVQHRRAEALHTSSTVLTPRMLAMVTDSGMTVTSGVALRDYVGWTEGMLTFNRTPLRDVVAELSRTYKTDIRIGDPTLAGKTLIADLDVRSKSLAQVLDIIGVAVNAHYVRDAAAFVLVPGRDGHNPRTDRVPQERLPQPEKHEYGR